MRALVSSFMGLTLALGLISDAPGQPGIHWTPSLEQATAQAAQTGRLVMVYFWAPWCPVCQEMERDVLSQPGVAATVHESMVAVKLNQDEATNIGRHYGVRSLPTVVVLAPNGAPLDRIEGRVAPNQLADRLKVLAAQPRQAEPSQAAVAGTDLPPSAEIRPVHAVPQNPPLGLDGYCAVSLSDDLLANRRRWVLGQRAHGVIHRGRTYLFADAEKAARFLQYPDRFAPVLSGQDAVLAVDEGRGIEGQREHGAFFGNRVYLFANQETLLRFENNPNRYADAAVRLSNRPGPTR